MTDETSSLPVPSNSQFAVARAMNPLDLATSEFRTALVRRGDNRKILIDWIRNALVEGVDYGKIHTTKRDRCHHGGPPRCTPEIEPYHWSKHSLWKPGAEKICGMLSITPVFPTLKQYEELALSGGTVSSIILRCTLITQDEKVVAEGVGARNVSQDYGDMNKALKMCEKSGHIDATLRMAGLSEIFTQDVEDMPPTDLQADVPVPVLQPAALAPPIPADPPRRPRNPATEKQVSLILRRLSNAGIDTAEYCQHFNIPSVPQTEFSRVDEGLKWIEQRRNQTHAQAPAHNVYDQSGIADDMPGSFYRREGE